MGIKNTIYIISLEPIESRYTWYWKDEIYKNINNFISINKLNFNVVDVPGDKISSEATSGAFLNFSQTNIWKNTQINKVCELFSSNKIVSGDKFLFTDAWHSGIIQIKYMSELLDIDVDIYNIWHAGSYDPYDFLGRKIKDKTWTFAAESSYFNCATKNFFATEYHKNLFESIVLKNTDIKSKVVGFPFEYIKDISKNYNEEKENIILFPHRVSLEKQPEIFKDLENELGNKYKFITCQDKKLSKTEYYKLLSKSKIVFSANLQETLGISCYEGSLFGSIPLVPNRLSYSEMYTELYFYDSCLTESYDSYSKNKSILISKIEDIINNYQIYRNKLFDLNKKLDKFFNSDAMFKQIFE